MLCRTYKYFREYFLNNYLFNIKLSQEAFSFDIKPINYPDKYELKQLHLISRHSDYYFIICTNIWQHNIYIFFNWLIESRYSIPDNVLVFEKLEKVFANVSVAKKWVKKETSIKLFLMFKRDLLWLFHKSFLFSIKILF